MNQILDYPLARENGNASSPGESAVQSVTPLSNLDLVRLDKLVTRLEELQLDRDAFARDEVSGTAAAAEASPDQWQALLKTVASLQSERDKAVSSLAQRIEEIVTLTQLLETARSRDAASQAEIRKLNVANQAQIQKLKQQVAEGQAKCERLRVAHGKLAVKVRAFEESGQRQHLMQSELVARLQAALAVKPLAKLTTQLRKARARFGSNDRRQRMLLTHGKSFPDGAAALENCVELLNNSVFFDATWYLERYSDVAESNALPDLHFLKYGAIEGRDPGPLFSTSRYLTLHPDVARSKMNPLIHYLKHGVKEQRMIEPAQVK